ncbi:GtrA family protein [Yoonia sp. BS5-3]|uniref:GtrA family protein n=1 Tax=Yoonia phaeophyticola TaxID=3137369 RepID=A0ABZ2V6U6_9RHOB
MDWAFLRFLAVGGSFSLSYALVTSALIRFASAPPLPTSVIIYLLCIPLAFWAQKKIAFRADQTGRSAMLIYAGTQVASLAVVSTITSRFVTRIFLWDTLIFLVTAGTAAVVSYAICRFIIFRHSPGSDAQ